MASLSTQDYCNLALGGLALVGTFMVGKIAVDSIIEARKERFDPKGQPKAAVKARESTLDGVMKVLATGYSVYTINQQMPELLGEVKKLLR